jgi:hypothetical protein
LATLQRNWIAKICPVSQTKLNTTTHRTDMIETWKDLTGRFMMCADITTSQDQIGARQKLFDDALKYLFYSEGPENDPFRVNEVFDLFFTNNKYINKMGVKVAFRNTFIPRVENYLKNNPSIIVYPTRRYRDEELEMTDALQNKVNYDFYKASLIRNELQYNYTLEATTCGELLSMMKELVEILDEEPSEEPSEELFTDLKRLFTGDCLLF